MAMRVWMAAAVAAGLGAGAAGAGTLTIEWVGGPQTYQGDLGSGQDETQITDPYQAAWVFDVPYMEPFSFAYTGVLDPSSGVASEFASYNPYDATLLSRPDGHLGGYFEGMYSITLVPAGVKLDAFLLDGDDQMSMNSKGIFEDHNQGLFTNSSTGYWTAMYVAGSAEEGTSFELLAPIPLPAGLPLMLAGLAGLGLVRRRQVRTEISVSPRSGPRSLPPSETLPVTCPTPATHRP